MRPPICALCDLDFRRDVDGGGGLVYFHDHQSLPDGRVGHPDGVEWFCHRHLKAAEALSPLSLGEAMSELRRRYRWRLPVFAWWRRVFRSPS